MVVWEGLLLVVLLIFLIKEVNGLYVVDVLMFLFLWLRLLFW